MSRFEELCAAYHHALEALWASRDESFQWAEALIARYLTYLEIPQHAWRFVPVHQCPDPHRTYTCLEALHLQPDTWWHLGFQLSLSAAPQEAPQQGLVIHLRFWKVDPQTFVVRIAENDPGHTIALDQDETFSAFFAFLQGQILRHCAECLRNFPQPPESLGELGFIPPG